VEGRAVPEGVEVSILDGCGGLSEEDAARVFDIGWQGSPARSPDSGPAATEPGWDLPSSAASSRHTQARSWSRTRRAAAGSESCYQHDQAGAGAAPQLLDLADRAADTGWLPDPGSQQRRSGHEPDKGPPARRRQRLLVYQHHIERRARRGTGTEGRREAEVEPSVDRRDGAAVQCRGGRDLEQVRGDHVDQPA